MKGVPLRIAMGPRDLENGTLELARRDTLEKNSVHQEGIEDRIATLLEEIQEAYLSKQKLSEMSILPQWIHFDAFKEVL